MPIENDDRRTDEDLASLSQSGSTEAADILLERYKGLVRSVARTRFLTGGDIDDLIQEGMIGLMKAIRDYRPDRDTSFRTFAALCIVRQMNTAIEAAGRLKNSPLNEAVSLTDDEWETTLSLIHDPSPEDIVVGEESTRELINEINEALSPYEKEVLRLYLKGYDYLEIARKTGRKPKAADNALQRIRTKARRIYEKHAT